MTDQRMRVRKESGCWKSPGKSSPESFRILATAFADMEAAIAAVNTGAIYKYVTKPWDPPQLENT